MTISCDRLNALFSRWSHLEDDKAAIQTDLSEMFKEAKGDGFNPKAMRAAFRIARKHGEDGAERDLADRDETNAYLEALGIGVATRACANEELPTPSDNKGEPERPSADCVEGLVATEAVRIGVVSAAPAEIPDIPDCLDRRRKTAA